VAWPDVPEDLLAGPRGRRVCFEVVTADGLGAASSPCPGWQAVWLGIGSAEPGQLTTELAALVADADLTAVAAADAETDLLEYLAGPVGYAAYWGEPDEIDRALDNEPVARTLSPVARAITASVAARWWSSAVAVDRQQYAQFLTPDADMDLPEPALTGACDSLARWHASTMEDEQDAASRPADPSAPFSRYWWSTPALSGLVSTTRSLPGLGATRLVLVEDAMGWIQARCWPLRPRSDVRVREISGPGDWTELVSRYPLDVSKSRRHDWFRVTGRADRWLIPDFEAVAADFDAVHVTVGGYLTTAGRALPVPGRDVGYATMLAGWDPDQTYWLADVLESAGPPVEWENPERDTLGWKPVRDNPVA
jgi:hypothetical protein